MPLPIVLIVLEDLDLLRIRDIRAERVRTRGVSRRDHFQVENPKMDISPQNPRRKMQS